MKLHRLTHRLTHSFKVRSGRYNSRHVRQEPTKVVGTHFEYCEELLPGRCHFVSPACLNMLDSVFGCTSSAGAPAIVTLPGLSDACIPDGCHVAPSVSIVFNPSDQISYFQTFSGS